MILNLMTKDKKISEEENRTLTDKPRCTWDKAFLAEFICSNMNLIYPTSLLGVIFGAGFSAALERIGGSREENGAFLWKRSS